MQRKNDRYLFDLFGEPAGTRTQDHLIKSQVLYHLSYGLAGAGVEARAGSVNSERGAIVMTCRPPMGRPIPALTAPDRSGSAGVEGGDCPHG
jgi:hypothetical protein